MDVNLVVRLNMYKKTRRSGKNPRTKSLDLAEMCGFNRFLNRCAYDNKNDLNNKPGDISKYNVLADLVKGRVTIPAPQKSNPPV